MISLRGYQQKGVADIRAAYIAGRKAPLFVLPTGGGKTVLFAYIAHNAASRGKKVLILVHRVELLRQTSKTLRAFGVRNGLINPQYTPDYSAGVQVASVQTASNRVGKMPFAPDLIIIDEAHHATASTWRKIISAYPKARILGVTATPVRGDGSGLGASAGGIFDELIEGPTAAELMELGYLVKPVVVVPKRLADASQIPKRMGDYSKSDLSEMMIKNKVITGDSIANYKKWCDGVPAVAFCVSVAHAELVAQEFRNAGYRAFAVDGSMDDEERAKRLAGLGNGTIDVITSCDLIGEGVDIPAIGCAILLRHTMSVGLHLQQIGRALRPCEGKERAVIIDQVGNCGVNSPNGFVRNLGLPWDQREWSLEGAPKGKRDSGSIKLPRIVQCKNCFAMHDPAPKCPVCDYADPAKARQLRQEDGELQEVTAGGGTNGLKGIDPKKQARMQQGKAQTLEELREIGRQRGYSAGWAEHVYRSRKIKA